MNGDAPVKDSTRDAVLTAMGDLSYTPLRAARSMRSSKTGLIGLITGAISGAQTTPELAGLPEVLIVQGIQRRFVDTGFTLVISDSGGVTDNFADLAQTFAQHRVEALIYVADHHREVDLTQQSAIDGLLLVNCFDRGGTPCILPDDRGGQRALVAELLKAGHRRIAFLTLPVGLVAHKLRLDGYRDALREAGIAYDPDLVIDVEFPHDNANDASLVSAAVDRLVSLPAPPTVVCCGNDRMALQLYGIFRSRGIAVPDDMSVAGFDDHRLISETLFPQLTTAVLPYRKMGERAAEVLLARLRGAPTATDASTSVISGPIVWRQSVTDLTSRAKQG